LNEEGKSKSAAPNIAPTGTSGYFFVQGFFEQALPTCPVIQPLESIVDLIFHGGNQVTAIFSFLFGWKF